MAGNSFGEIFKISTFGESHGEAVGVVIDGCPAGVDFDEELLRYELLRRRPGQSKVTTARNEPEQPIVLSGVFEGQTTGTPIAILVYNRDARTKDYDNLKDIFRPSHADYTYLAKYGRRDYRGGGRASARETVARVMAGAVAKMILKTAGIELLGFTKAIGALSYEPDSLDEIRREKIESNIIRCPDEVMAAEMEAAILQAKAEGDTLGGIVQCVIKGVPAGLGEPVFDKLHASLGKAVLSIPACKGFEIGTGFQSARMKGSQLNDLFITRENTQITTASNHSGGIQGGISNGQNIVFSAAFKPVSTILQKQKTLDIHFNPIEYIPKGRHDPSVVPRAVPIVEAMAAIVICDFWLRNRISVL